MKSVLMHLVLALVGLGLAYRAWTKKDEDAEAGSDESVTLVDCTPARLQEIVLLDGAKRVALSQKKDGGTPYFWVRTQVESTAPADEKNRVTEFALSKEVNEFLKAALPFRATRSLGQLTAEQLKDTKLAEPEDHLTIACGGKKHEFDLGSEAFGSGDYYVRPKGQTTVYLVASKAVSDLMRADSALMLRELIPVEMSDIETVTVRAEGREKKLKQLNRLDKRKAEWVDAAEPDRRNELYSNWLARVRQLRVEQYLPEGSEPGTELASPAPYIPVAKLDYRDSDGKELGAFEFGVVQSETPIYYARSTATHAWVRVLASVGKQVAQDVAPVLGLESASQAD
ncbi:MAG: DUF4340 domain-containing protein [Polyangiales bacterium]|nr:DUF4340 domain-containing protein [Myxococcales bacterium]